MLARLICTHTSIRKLQQALLWGPNGDLPMPLSENIMLTAAESVCVNATNFVASTADDCVRSTTVLISAYNSTDYLGYCLPSDTTSSRWHLLHTSVNKPPVSQKHICSSSSCRLHAILLLIVMQRQHCMATHVQNAVQVYAGMMIARPCIAQQVEKLKHCMRSFKHIARLAAAVYSRRCLHYAHLAKNLSVNTATCYRLSKLTISKQIDLFWGENEECKLADRAMKTAADIGEGDAGRLMEELVPDPRLCWHCHCHEQVFDDHAEQ